MLLSIEVSLISQGRPLFPFSAHSSGVDPEPPTPVPGFHLVQENREKQERTEERGEDGDAREEAEVLAGSSFVEFDHRSVPKSEPTSETRLPEALMGALEKGPEALTELHEGLASPVRPAAPEREYPLVV